MRLKRARHRVGALLQAHGERGGRGAATGQRLEVEQGRAPAASSGGGVRRGPALVVTAP